MLPVLKEYSIGIVATAVGFLVGYIYTLKYLKNDDLWDFINKARAESKILLFLSDGKVYYPRYVPKDNLGYQLCKTNKGEYVIMPQGTLLPLVGQGVMIGVADVHRCITTPLELLRTIEDLRTRGVSNDEIATFLKEVVNADSLDKFKRTCLEKYEKIKQEIMKDKKIMAEINATAEKLAEEKGLKKEDVVKYLVDREANERFRKEQNFSIKLFMAVSPEVSSYIRRGINAVTIGRLIELNRERGLLEKSGHWLANLNMRDILIYAGVFVIMVAIAKSLLAGGFFGHMMHTFRGVAPQPHATHVVRKVKP